MTCSDYEEQISAYIDDELSDDRARELFTHLGNCFGCRKGMLSMLNLRSGLVSQASPLAPEELDARILGRTMGRIHIEDRQAAPGFIIGRRLSVPTPAAIGVACLLVALGVALSTFMGPFTERVPEPRVQTVFLSTVPTVEVRAYTMQPVTIN